MDKEHIINLSFTVYKVTEPFSKEEPLKTEIRTRVNDILNDLLIFESNQELGIRTNPLGKEIAENIERLKKYFELAIVEELTSPTNFLVLQREYDKISKEVEKEMEEKELIKEETSSRQKEILDIISKKQKIQVQGIQDSLSGISKRTIQRDLGFLINNGLVKAHHDFNKTFYELV